MQKNSETASPTCPVCLSTCTGHFVDYNECTTYRCEGCQAVFLFPYVSLNQAEEMYNPSIDRVNMEIDTRKEKKMRRARRRARRLKSYTKGNRFLDVGSNVGYMTESARESGFEATGIELAPNYVKLAREQFPKNTFINGYIEEMDVPDGGFDMVYCSEVIEHVPDPRAFAAALARQVAPGGYLYVTTPDIAHRGVPKDIATWDAFCPPAHCVYYTPNNLRALFEENGLTFKKKSLAFKPGIKMLFQRPVTK